ncbi:MAG TPA: hypothetical protein VFF19_35550 [Reyranella sp.]|jgi:hypothetical protein|nr:hypothetical protein [Reyranella sp.]
MSTKPIAHDPSVGEDAYAFWPLRGQKRSTSPASLGRNGYLEGRRNAAER